MNVVYLLCVECIYHVMTIDSSGNKHKADES